MSDPPDIRDRVENEDGVGLDITIRDGYAIVSTYDDGRFEGLAVEFDREPIDGHPLSAAATALARHGLTVEHADEETWDRLAIRGWLKGDREVLDVLAKLNATRATTSGRTSSTTCASTRTRQTKSTRGDGTTEALDAVLWQIINAHDLTNRHTTSHVAASRTPYMALAADDCPGGADCDHDSDPRIVWTVRRTCTTEPCQHHGDGAAPTGCWEHPTLTATAALERWNTTVKIWDLLDTDGFNEAKDPTAAFDDEARYQEVENRMLSTHELRRDDVEILYA